MSVLKTPSRRTVLKTAALGAAGFALPAVFAGRSVAQAKQITIADVGGAAGEAIKTAFCDPFTAETGITVLNIAASDPVSQTKLAVDASTYVFDAVMVTQDMVARLTAEKNYLAPLGITAADGADMVPGMLTDNWMGFSVFGIVMAYRTDTFPDGPKTWADFWDVAKFPGRRGLYRGAGGMLEMALLADGVAPADLYPLDVDRAFAQLDKIKDSVAVWWTSGAQNTQILQSGEVDMTDTWSGRAFAATASGAPVKTVWNGLYSVDGWSIPVGTPNLAEAQQFVKFCMRPEQQAVYSSLVANGPTNTKAFGFLPPERGQALPTFPANLANLTQSNAAWWSENNDMVTERMEEWLLA